VERQFRLPDAEAKIAALPSDIAEQVREAREALPGLLLKVQEAEAQAAELIGARKGLTKEENVSLEGGNVFEDQPLFWIVEGHSA
jgi:hypothetical protein